MAKAEINLNTSGHGSLVIDGQDLSSVVIGFTLTGNPRHGSQLVLDLAAIDVTVDADVAVDLPEDVTAALTALGWTPPTVQDEIKEDQDNG